VFTFKLIVESIKELGGASMVVILHEVVVTILQEVVVVDPKNPRSYATRLQGPWIMPTWNPWYPPWYLFQPLIEIFNQVGNLYPTPFTLQEQILMLMYKFFARPFKLMEKTMMMVSSIFIYFYTS
jgi:hypothetical protein